MEMMNPCWANLTALRRMIVASSDTISARLDLVSSLSMLTIFSRFWLLLLPVAATAAAEEGWNNRISPLAFSSCWITSLAVWSSLLWTKSESMRSMSGSPWGSTASSSTTISPALTDNFFFSVSDKRSDLDTWWPATVVADICAPGMRKSASLANRSRTIFLGGVSFPSSSSSAAAKPRLPCSRHLGRST